MKAYMITEQHINNFHTHLIRDEKSKATIEKYIRDINHFRSYLGRETLTTHTICKKQAGLKELNQKELNQKELNKEEIILYKNYLIENYEPASVNSMLASLNAFFKYMNWHELIVKSVKIQKQTFRDEERELSKEEYLRLLSAAKKQNKYRLYLIMQTICSTGIRVSELKFITIEAVRTGKVKVYLKGKTRIVFLPKELCKELKLYMKHSNMKQSNIKLRDAKQRIFVTRTGKNIDRSNILHEMKALCGEAKVSKKKVFPHNLRHLFACMYYKSVHDLSRLADLLGHSNVNTTRIYTSVSGHEQSRQMEKLGLVYAYGQIKTT